MHKLPQITDEYESRLLDEYTDLYFELKREESDIPHIPYTCCKRFPRMRENNNRYGACMCKRQQRVRDNSRDRLRHIQNICFNKRDSMIPQYFLSKISSSLKGRNAISNARKREVCRKISILIDCELMDCKNISDLIYSYASKDYMYAYEYLYDRNVCLLFTIEVNSFSYLEYTQGGWSILPEESYTWVPSGLPPIVTVEEYHVSLSGKVECFPVDISRHKNSKECGYKKCVVCDYAKFHHGFTLYKNKDSLLSYIVCKLK